MYLRIYITILFQVDTRTSLGWVILRQHTFITGKVLTCFRYAVFHQSSWVTLVPSMSSDGALPQRMSSLHCVLSSTQINDKATVSANMIFCSMYMNQQNAQNSCD